MRKAQLRMRIKFSVLRLSSSERRAPLVKHLFRLGRLTHLSARAATFGWTRISWRSRHPYHPAPDWFGIIGGFANLRPGACIITNSSASVGMDALGGLLGNTLNAGIELHHGVVHFLTGRTLDDRHESKEDGHSNYHPVLFPYRDGSPYRECYHVRVLPFQTTFLYVRKLFSSTLLPCSSSTHQKTLTFEAASDHTFPFADHLLHAAMSLSYFSSLSPYLPPVLL